MEKNELSESGSLLIGVKVDLVIGNPPFSIKKVGNKKTHPIWDKFVKKSFELCKDGGYVALVHPGAWRDVEGRFKDTQELLRSKQVEYLELHNTKDGFATFKVGTDYGWYVVRNVENTKKTEIKFQDSEPQMLDIRNMEFIPNAQLEKFQSLFAKDGEEKTEIMYDRTMYETRQPYVAKTKTKKFRYPCAYMVAKGDGVKPFWSAKKLGHFGVPKLIWSNGAVKSAGSFADTKGKYGLTQFAYAIVDTPKNLPKIKAVFDSKEFRDFIVHGSPSYLSINRKVISLFRKDWWKGFLK